MKETIGVIGHTGVTGKAVFNWFKKQGYPVMGYSLDRYTHSWDEINNQAEWIFVCVPTPYDWQKKEVNLSILEEVLKKIKSGKKVIHKSTVPPGTTQKLQNKFIDLKLLYNAEFLSGATAEADFSCPDRQLVGYTTYSYNIATEALNLLPESPYGVIMKATEVEICKFINNFHGALMVIFSNFFYDISNKFNDLDFEKIKKAASASKWVGSPMKKQYWNVWSGGFRGYGGRCFIKDIKMLLDWCKANGVSDEILKATRKANKRLLKEQGITEQEAEKR